MRKITRFTGAVVACAAAALVAAPASGAELGATVTPTPSPTATPAATPAATSNVAPNAAPTTVPDNATVEIGKTVIIPVLANDSDPDGDTLTLTAVTNGGHGSASLAGQDVAYTASVGFVGSDSFSYTVSDPLGATATGTVTVTLTAPPESYANTVNVPATVVALRASSIAGTVGPASSEPLRVVLQRRRTAGWGVVQRSVAGSTGTYRFSYVPTAAGTITWRTIATWADGTAVTSATRTMKVLARLDAKVSGPLARVDVPYSYRVGCPVSPPGLRRISMTYYGYTGQLKRGDLIVSAGAVEPLLNVFQSGFNARFPLKKVQATDFYYAKGKRSPSGSDVAAMKAGNTSAFNCRPVTGNPYRRSQHSYGNAIDINTFENPYVTGSRVYPSKARSYLNRSRHRTGMILKRGALAKAMRRNGWSWGARWAHPDYQHFSANGG